MQRNARYNGYTICPIERCFPLPGVSLPPGRSPAWRPPLSDWENGVGEKRLFHPRRAANAIAGALAAEGAASK